MSLWSLCKGLQKTTNLTCISALLNFRCFVAKMVLKVVQKSLESICDQKMGQFGEHWFAQQLGSDGLDVHCAGCSFDKASIKDYTYTLYIIFHHINKFNHLCWFSFSKSSSLFLNPRDPARYFPNCVSSGGNLGTVCTSGLSAAPHCSALACNAQCWIGQRSNGVEWSAREA